MVTFTEKIFSGKFRFKINVVLKESEKKTRKKDIKIDKCVLLIYAYVVGNIMQ